MPDTYINDVKKIYMYIKDIFLHSFLCTTSKTGPLFLYGNYDDIILWRTCYCDDLLL